MELSARKLGRAACILAVCWSTLAAGPNARSAPKGVISLEDYPAAGLTVEVSVNGAAGRFLFDTGWGVTAVTPAFAKRIGCIPWGRVTGFRATGQRVDEQKCPGGVLQTSGVLLRAPTLAVFDLSPLLPPGQSYAGGLGLDVFAGQALTIQTHAHRIIVESPASLRARVRRAKAAPIRIVRDAQGAALTVDIGIPTARGMIWMELDTGNNGPILVGRHIADLVGLSQANGNLQTLDLPIAPGIVAHSPARVEDLILDGDLGRNFLEHWDLTLDLGRGWGWLAAAQS